MADPTFEQLLEAAGRANQAGDENAARALVEEAKRLYPQGATPGQSSPRQGFKVVDIEGIPTEVPQGWTPEQLFQPTPPRENKFGDVIGPAMEGPWETTKAFARGVMDYNQSPTNAALPDWLRGPARGLAATAGDVVMTGVGALGTGLAGAAGLVGEVVGGDTTSERKLTRDLMMMTEVAVPELSGVSGTMRAGATAARAADRAASTPVTAAQSGARAAEELGITPSLGMTGRTGAVAASGLEKVPLAGNLIARDATRAVGEVEGAFARIRDRIGTALGPAGAGDALQTGLENFVARFKNMSSELYAKVDEVIPSDQRFPVTATVARADDAKAAFAGNPELAQKLGLNNLDAVLMEATENGVTWEALKQFRSSVGEAIGNARSGRQGGSLSSENLSRLEGLYAALTEDMTAAARAAGPDAFRLWRRANNHYRGGAERIERSLDATIRADSPERAWDAFSRLLQADRASSDITRVRQIKSSLEADEWNTVAASIVDRLGRAPAGQQNAAGDVFSPSVFLTNWNKMDGEARRLLLPEDARVELEQLARVAERVKAANAERNFSNTGHPIGWTALIFGSAADMGTTAAALGGATLTARGMTSPIFLRAMNRAARGDMRDISAMARGNGPFKTDAMTVLRLAAADAAQGGAAANSNNNPLGRASNAR